MEGLWLENQNLTFRDDLPIPEPGPGEALIRVTRAGICSTDLALVRGYYPFTGIPGHEFVGVVEDTRSGTDLIGKRVVGEININCGKCYACIGENISHCEHRKALGIKGHHGTFGQYITLPIRNLHQVPVSVSDDAAVFTEPLAAALEILEQVSIGPTDRILLIGAGRLGQLIARVLITQNSELLVVAKYGYQEDSLKGIPVSFINEDEIPGRKMDIVIEASGSPGGLGLALQAVRGRGTILLKSTYAGKFEMNPSELVVNEISLIGSRCGPFKPAIQLLRRQKIDPTPLISRRYDLRDGIKAFAAAGEKGVIKILFDRF